MKAKIILLLLENEVYIDDIICAEDILLLRQARDQLTRMLMAGGFQPHKWANDPRLLEDIPDIEHGLEKVLGMDSNLKVKNP